jgi:hypothetical protein
MKKVCEAHEEESTLMSKILTAREEEYKKIK